MRLASFLGSAVAVATAFATASVWAGCNCNVPPSPASFPASATMGAPMGLGGGGYGGAGYGATPSSGAPMSYDASMMPYGGMVATNGPHWAPGGYEPRIGSPAYYYDPSGGQYVVTGNPYNDHFGPGFQRSSVHGHYRFPYYDYRAPWYFPGRAVYNRNTNFPW